MTTARIVFQTATILVALMVSCGQRSVTPIIEGDGTGLTPVDATAPDSPIFLDSAHADSAVDAASPDSPSVPPQNSCLDLGGYCGHYLVGCKVGYSQASHLLCDGSKSAVCCLPQLLALCHGKGGYCTNYQYCSPGYIKGSSSLCTGTSLSNCCLPYYPVVCPAMGGYCTNWSSCPPGYKQGNTSFCQGSGLVNCCLPQASDAGN